MINSSRIVTIMARMEVMARRAGAILTEHLGKLKESDISRKGCRDFLTRADKAAESCLLEDIAEHFPGHAVLAEESGHHGDLAAGGEGFLWIIDPLDGTTNFVHQIPMFAVSIGLFHDGEPLAGCIFAPRLEELFLAGRGEGATLNGEPIAVTGTTTLMDAMLATGFAYRVDELERNNLDHFAHLIPRTRGVRRCGSAAMDLAWTACGRFDGFWELHLSPWDVAAGALIVREAGGRVCDFSGGENWLKGGEIIAGGAEMVEHLKLELNRSGK